MAGLSTAARWTLAGLIVVAALIAAMLLQIHDREGDRPTASPSYPETLPDRDRRDADTPEALSELRRRAGLAACPVAGAQAVKSPLTGVVLECAGDGSSVDVGRAFAGRNMVVNIWAYWCAPCAQELPAMAELQRRAGDRLTVVTVHQDENEAAGLAKLAELQVRLPTLQDGARRVATALHTPNVMPMTVLIRADGSVARVLPRVFSSAEEISAEVESALGVRV